MKDIFKKFYEFSQLQYLFWKKEKSPKLKTDLFKRMKMLAKGFHGESWSIYNFQTNDMNQYLSDYDRLKTKFINGDAKNILNNKLTFEQDLKDDLNIPTTFSFIQNGKFIPKNKNVIIKSVEDLVNYLKEKEKVVLKPTNGGGGTGVMILSLVNNEFTVNGKRSELAGLDELIENLNNYFISEFIIQGEYGNEFFPNTINTIRVLTMIDPETKKPFIPIAVQRMGCNNSQPTDNWSQGGFCAEIDLETGELSAALTFPKNRKVEWFDKHPETGAQIKGLIVPKWKEIKEGILNVVEKHPHLIYVGWDVVTTEDGYMILEGNNCSDVNLLQIHTPLLTIPQAKNFYKYHNII